MALGIDHEAAGIRAAAMKQRWTDYGILCWPSCVVAGRVLFCRPEAITPPLETVRAPGV